MDYEVREDSEDFEEDISEQEDLKQKAGEFVKATGALAGTLGKFALKKGSELKDKIEDEDFQNKTEDSLKKLKDKAASSATIVVNKATEYAEDKTKKIQDYIDDGEDSNKVEESSHTKEKKEFGIFGRNKKSSISKEEKKKKDLIRIFLSIGALLIALGILALVESIENRGKIYPPSEDISKMQYKEVVELFSKAGFTDISTKKIEKTDEETSKKNGSVKTATIDGERYDVDDKYSPDAKVVVSYYSVRKAKKATKTKENSSKMNEEQNVPTEEERSELQAMYGKKCAEATPEIEALGFTPKYLASNTKHDMTFHITEYEPEAWTVYQLVSVEEKTATYIVRNKWMEDNNL